MSPGSGWSAAQLGYCGNVHPAPDLAALRASIQHPFQGVRRRRGLAEQDSGLWISARAAAELQSVAARAAFLDLLRDSGLRLTSLNGFPYGQFHQGAVKAEVYLPDWADPRRLEYSLQLARLLAAALPADCARGVISSVPLGYAATWDTHRQQRAGQQLRQLTAALAALQRETGKQIVLCLEMEPDCVLETTDQAIAFFRHWQASDPHHAHLALCFDVCHQAVVFEDCYQSLDRLLRAGIAIGKIQLSNALVCTLPAPNHPRHPQVLQALGDFVESTYLHQVKARDRQARMLAWADLPAALAHRALDLGQCAELRIHFHVPLFSEQLLLPELGGSQDALFQTFDFLADHPRFHPVLEVETYSWNVLPPQLRPQTEEELLQGIATELQWVEAQLHERCLLSPRPRQQEARAHVR
ncbi:metabolite traffic protein EboE [Pseudomonas gingeri]|uniref:Metabolite traffic protein EboE n=1 Tax=Pseudomonas gingeri TaxID=117681 RepID=A0A7Y7YF63_9PSED|nr:metabolite traffic protein EboE [Pseudomonas gingeri]NWA02742.1 metabolite traffic protein EboE [Pseudomonas gingeri]NWA12084.1 metabolite traffic protein EboE [Pseudomonas gingeri]NWA57509.1 metabolite traffic protein EboE [Pseudomonas gingeri]NWA93852.1 metabolite traffic protein EboE [Pseudomonas gingeri]NWB03324.1 metabolite traffic protein EboE [Pseudomonas gingeri]